MKLSRLLSSREDDDDDDAAGAAPATSSLSMSLTSPSLSPSSPTLSPSSPTLSPSSPTLSDLLSPPSVDARGAELASFDLGRPHQGTPADPNLHFTVTFGPSVSPTAAKTQSGKLPSAVKKRQSKPVAFSSPAAKTTAKRKRARKLSPKQMQRWLEKEADDSQIYNLTLDVNDLKQQVQHYEMQRSVCDTRMLIARYNHNGASMRTVDMFFKIFSDGYRDMNREEQGFLVSSTDDILSLGTVAYGRHFLFEQWERYTRLFHMRNFRNWSMIVMTDDPECTIVRCDGKFDGRITRETIEVVFPHVLDDEELVQRVIGCKICVPVQTLVYFDAAGRIVRYDAHADVFQGLNDLLASNPQDVITMMANARINDACMIPDGPGEMPEEMPFECLSPTSPIPRFFPIEEEEDARLSLDYILSSELLRGEAGHAQPSFPQHFCICPLIATSPPVFSVDKKKPRKQPTMQHPPRDEAERPLLADPSEFHVEFDYETGYDYACCLTTTISALVTGGLALLCYPCITKLVRKEVDSQKCTVTENRVVLESGWLNRTTRYIPLDRIQDVNVQESIVHRHFGIKGVEIQTAGVGIGRMPEAYLLAPRDASGVRQVIMSRRDQLMFGRHRGGGGDAAQDRLKETKGPQLSGYDNAVVRELRELKESVLRIEAQIGESVSKMEARESVKTLD